MFKVTAESVKNTLKFDKSVKNALVRKDKAFSLKPFNRDSSFKTVYFKDFMIHSTKNTSWRHVLWGTYCEAYQIYYDTDFEEGLYHLNTLDIYELLRDHKYAAFEHKTGVPRFIKKAKQRYENKVKGLMKCRCVPKSNWTHTYTYVTWLVRHPCTTKKSQDPERLIVERAVETYCPDFTTTSVTNAFNSLRGYLDEKPSGNMYEIKLLENTITPEIMEEVELTAAVSNL